MLKKPQTSNFEPQINHMIIFLGDSITEWGDWKTLLSEFDIENYGVHGNKTYQVIERVGELFGKKADQLFLLIGINDLGDNRSISDIENDYIELLKLLLENNVAQKFNLISVLPVQPHKWKKPGLTIYNINKLNDKIKVVAENQSLNFVDIHFSFTDENGELKEEFTTDGLHLSEAGYLNYKDQIVNSLHTIC